MKYAVGYVNSVGELRLYLGYQNVAFDTAEEAWREASEDDFTKYVNDPRVCEITIRDS